MATAMSSTRRCDAVVERASKRTYCCAVFAYLEEENWRPVESGVISFGGMGSLPPYGRRTGRHGFGEQKSCADTCGIEAARIFGG